MSSPFDGNISSPNLSQSLDEWDQAQLTDENSNVFPLVAAVAVDASGHSNLGFVVPKASMNSQVTGRRQPPQVVCPGGEKIPVLGLVGLDASGNPVPFSAASAKVLSGKFQSTVQTGNGSQQSIAHGLGVVPSLVLVSVYSNGAGGEAWTVAEGTHDATNLYVTVTTGLSYKAIALA